MRARNEELRTRIKEWWATTTVADIALRCGVSPGLVSRLAKEMGLPAKKFRSAGREAHGRRVGDIMRRRHCRQPDPVRLKPARAMFGAPIRVLDHDTQALIDAALGVRKRPRKGSSSCAENSAG